MLAWCDHGFVDIKAMALKAAINGSIFADPNACFAMMMALPFGSTRALPTAHAIKPDHLGNALQPKYARLRGCWIRNVCCPPRRAKERAARGRPLLSG